MLFPPSVMVQEERGWMATNAVRRRQGQWCSCALSPPGCCGMGEQTESSSVVGECWFLMLGWSPFALNVQKTGAVESQLSSVEPILQIKNHLLFFMCVFIVIYLPQLRSWTAAETMHSVEMMWHALSDNCSILRFITQPSRQCSRDGCQLIHNHICVSEASSNTIKFVSIKVQIELYIFACLCIYICILVCIACMY